MPRSKRGKGSNSKRSNSKRSNSTKRSLLDELSETLSLPELESDEPLVSVNVPKKKKSKKKKKKKKKSKAWSAKLHGKGTKGKKGKKSHKKKHKKKMKGGSKAEQARILNALNEGKFGGPTHIIQNYPALNGQFNGLPCFIEDEGPPIIVSVLKEGGNLYIKTDYYSLLEVTDNQLKEIPQ
tara:strand:- start:144 stop:686 length:543 start_codon:yes stop_codon:yes gene_type:complete